jgi:hypothetical protein
MSKLLALSAASVLALCAPALARQPDSVARKVACNKGWSVYMKENRLQGVAGARKEYQAGCESGRIPVPVKARPGR